MLELLHLWLSSYAPVVLVLALALCVGYPMSRTIVRGPAGPLLALFLGLAIFSLVVCLLAWFRMFDGVSLALVAAVALGVSSRCLLLDLPEWRRRALEAKPSRTLVAGMGVLCLVLLAFSLLTLYPSTTADVNGYHLPLARDLVQHHGLVYDPFVRYSFFPQANESLFGVVLLLSSDPVSSAALEYSVLACVVLTMPLWFVGSGRRPVAGFIAALMVLASPVVIWAGTAAFVDAWALAFVAVGLVVGLDAAEGRGRALPMFALCGVLLGEAAATKYTGVMFGGCAFVGVLFAARGPGFRPVWLLVTLASFALIAAPWYLWTVHTTGDPVYPFATGLFGNRSGLWTAGEIDLQKFIARAAGSGVRALVNQDLYYWRGGRYLAGLDGSPLSWFLVAGFLPLLWPPAWRDRTFIAVAVASGLCVVVSLFISADPRYLVPALGVLALCAGLAADRAIRGMNRTSVARLGQPRLAAAGCVLAAIPILWSSASYANAVRSTNGLPPTTPAAIRRFLATRVSCYGAVTFLNRIAGSKYRAWSPGCQTARYYANGVLIGDVFSTGSAFRVFDRAGIDVPNDQTLWNRLAPLNVQWLILPSAKLSNPNALEAHGLFTLATSVGTADVFKVRISR